MSDLLDAQHNDGDEYRQMIQDVSGISEIFKVLADETRTKIAYLLLNRELCVHDLAAALGMSQSAVSHQLRSLREMHLVRHRKQGRKVYYQLDDEHISELFQGGLDHVNHSNQP